MFHVQLVSVSDKLSHLCRTMFEKSPSQLNGFLISSYRTEIWMYKETQYAELCIYVQGHQRNNKEKKVIFAGAEMVFAPVSLHA
jgi:hypothetical protein